MSVLRDVIGAHALQFERPERVLTYDEAAGARLLATFVVAGLILQPALRALARAAGLSGERWIGLAIVLVLFAAVILGVRGFARVGAGGHRSASMGFVDASRVDLRLDRGPARRRSVQHHVP